LSYELIEQINKMSQPLQSTVSVAGRATFSRISHAQRYEKNFAVGVTCPTHKLE